MKLDDLGASHEQDTMKTLPGVGSIKFKKEFRKSRREDGRKAGNPERLLQVSNEQHLILARSAIILILSLLCQVQGKCSGAGAEAGLELSDDMQICISSSVL